MNVFVTGGTGYIGTRLIAALVRRGHRVRAVVRRGSEKKLAAGVRAVVADPLQFDSYTADISPGDRFVHLIGVPHPSPAKAKQFREIDLVSIQVAVRAARRCRRPAFYLPERCPTCTGYERVYRSAETGRRITAIEWDTFHVGAAMVRARTRTLVALSAVAILLDGRTIAGHPGICPSPGPCHRPATGRRIDLDGGEGAAMDFRLSMSQRFGRSAQIFAIEFDFGDRGIMISLAPKNSDDIELDPADGGGFFQRERLPAHLILQSQQLGGSVA